MTSPEWSRDDDGGYLADLALKLASHGGGESSADLALDILLHQIVEQARIETMASGAAIALVHGGEVVCRATIGESAPDLGVRLSTRSGLSGACYQTRQIQQCDDTETDPRVDAAACRHLEIRSMAVLPVLGSGDLQGLLEVYAPHPAAFGDAEIRILQALCRRIAENVGHAAAVVTQAPEIAAREPLAVPMKVEEIKVASPPPMFESFSPVDDRRPMAPRIHEVQPEIPSAEISTHSFLPQRGVRRDYWTAALTSVVLALALLLGWMIGRRSSWQPDQHAASAPKPAPVAETTEIEMEPPVGSLSPKTSHSELHPGRAAQKTSVNGITQASIQSSLQPKASNDANAAGGLVVYERGKVIFRMPPSAPSSGSASMQSTAEQSKPAANEPSAATMSAAGGPDSSSAPVPVSLSPQTAAAYLVRKIEPTYPEQAKQQKIGGAVVLDTLVGKDGAVHEIKIISGDPQLAPSAVDALRQWRFRPYSPQGQPVDFETRVTVNFTP